MQTRNHFVLLQKKKADNTDRKQNNFIVLDSKTIKGETTRTLT